MKPTSAVLICALLAVSTTHAASADTAPSGKLAVYVQIIDADVPASYIPSIVNAMKNPKTRVARLAALEQDITRQGRYVFIADGVNSIDVPHPRITRPSAPVIARAVYNIPSTNPPKVYPGPGDTWPVDHENESLSTAWRLNPKNIAIVSLTLDEFRSAYSAKGGLPIIKYNRQYRAKALRFYSGQTRLLGNYAQSVNIHHLVFVEVAILPLPH